MNIVNFISNVIVFILSKLWTYLLQYTQRLTVLNLGQLKLCSHTFEQYDNSIVISNNALQLLILTSRKMLEKRCVLKECLEWQRTLNYLLNVVETCNIGRKKKRLMKFRSWLLVHSDTFTEHFLSDSDFIFLALINIAQEFWSILKKLCFSFFEFLYSISDRSDRKFLCNLLIIIRWFWLEPSWWISWYGN
jgi:hypothetical protein